MAHLTRTHNWAKTPLGLPDTWPQSLRTTLGIVLHSALPMMLLWGDEHTYFYNDAARPNLGNDGKHPALGKRGAEVWGEAWDFAEPLLKQVKASGEPVFSEDQLVPVLRNGRMEDAYWTFSFNPVYGDLGGIDGVFITVTETTNHVIGLKKLQTSEQYYHQLTDSVPAIIWETRPDGYCTHLNRQWYKITGQTEEEAEGFGWLDATHPDDKDEAGRVFMEANVKQAPFSILYRLRQKDGFYRWSIDKGNPRFSPEGTYEGMVGTVTDVHEQQSAEKDLQESEERFRTMAEDSDILIAVGNETSDAVYFSKAWVNLTGRPMQELLDFGWVDLVHPDDRERYVTIYLSAFEKQEPFTGEFRLLSRTGEYRWLLANGSVRFRSDNSFAGYISSCVDITGRKQAEEALRLSEERQTFLLRLSDRLRSLTGSADIQYQAACALGEYTGASRVGYAEDMQDGQTIVVTRNYTNGVPGIEGRYRYEDYGASLMAELQVGRTVIRPDIANDPSLTNAEKQAHAQLQLGATLNKPLVKNGRLVAVLFLHYDGPHAFSEQELNLLNETAERTWEAVGRARAEEALRASEAKLRSIIDTAPVAIGLFMGRDLVIELPNQTFIDIVGKGPDIEGKPLREVMPELLTENQPFLQILDDVFTSGKPFQSYGSIVQIVQQGVMTHNYYNITYTPLFNEAGEVYAILDIAVDVTGQISAQQKVEASEARFRNLIQEAPVATCLYVGPDAILELVNPAMVKLFGKGDAIIGKPFLKAIPEMADQPFPQLLAELYRTGNTHEGFSTPADIVVDGVMGRYYFDFTYKPLRNTAGDVYAILCMAVDVTEQLMARQQVEQSEQQLRQLVEHSPVAVSLLIGRELIVERVNNSILALWGKDHSVIGKPLAEALPELVGQPFLPLLDEVYTTGKAYYTDNDRAELEVNGVLRTYYLAFSYTPIRNAAYEVYAILITATDVTEQVLIRQQIETSEAKLRSAVESAPLPIAVYAGREMRIELANQTILDIWGKGNEVIGQRYAEVLPELENQAVFDQLNGVYTTGIPFHAKNQRIDLVIDGRLQPYHFNYSFTPLFDADGRVYGVMNTGIDITDLAVAKQKIEETEAALRGAIELAQLGAWELDVITGRFTVSDRVKNWFGFADNLVPLDGAFNAIYEPDRDRVLAAFNQALQPGSDGIYDAEYILIEPTTGRELIIHAQGKTFFDTQGKPLKLSGTIHDITIQRELQLALENEVQERTRQLQASVQDLERSNQNLQQFAYIASHDLQEPLRKIQSFGDILKTQYASQLGEGVDLLQRMQVAASRMSGLIKDLLAFSRISTRQEASAVVPLAEVVKTVLNDLELVVQETGAVVEISPLPTVKGDPSQLSQLFQNLLSNALKFQRADPSGALTVPHIRVTTKQVSATDLPSSAKPTRETAAYYCIDVVDNGIGFDQKYADRIFQVFQRLHGRTEFAGTGIGLAICEKVVANHGGAITAFSRPGQGATFSVYLPVA